MNNSICTIPSNELAQVLDANRDSKLIYIDGKKCLCWDNFVARLEEIYGVDLSYAKMNQTKGEVTENLYLWIVEFLEATDVICKLDFFDFEMQGQLLVIDNIDDFLDRQFKAKDWLINDLIVRILPQWGYDTWKGHTVHRKFNVVLVDPEIKNYI